MKKSKLNFQYRNKILKLGKIIFVPTTLFFLFLSFASIFLAIENVCPNQKLASFLENINKYGNVFTITIALITVGLILNQITLAFESNKIGPRAQWKESFESYLRDQKPSSQHISLMIQNYFLENLEEIFEFLYSLDKPMRLSNKAELIEFFNMFIKPKVREFELDSVGYHQNNRSYKSLDTSYSITDIQKVLRHLLNSSIYYNSLEFDYTYLYMLEVNKMVEEHKMLK